MQSWQTQRDENVQAKLAHMAQVAEERFQAAENAREIHRSLSANLAQEASQYTELQLEIFAVAPQSFEFVESKLAQLPRQRQREHFRKLYLQAYRSVSDDGSIAFQFGNKQRKYANDFLRETLDVRLQKVLAQYGVNFNFQQAFADTVRNVAQLKSHIRETLLGESHKSAVDFGDSFKVKASLPFYLIGESKLKQMAYHFAMLFSQYQWDYVHNLLQQAQPLSSEEINDCIRQLYQRCGALCASLGFPLPHWEKFSQHKRVKGEQIDIALNKVACEKYWFRQMRAMQKRMVEHIAIACGEVRKQASSYISFGSFQEWLVQQRKNHAYLKAMILENVDNPEEQLELFDQFIKSSSNPALRRNEMMVRLRGIEEWAEQYGNEALFLTLTAPSSFHAINSKSGKMNQKWQGNSPRATQAYLNKVWQQFRAMLAKRDIKIYGMRVAEPHHDATPHWHLLVYVPSADKAEVIRLFKLKALELEGDEQGALLHRCKVEECDKSKGSATAYISKYISKNIDGFALSGETSDENPNLSLQDNAKRVRAWASRWGIRQFQFYGGASISVWRELRRLIQGQADDEIIAKAQAVADVSCYASYLEIQGGALAKRVDQPIRLDYETKQPNQYGEQRKAIIGLANRFNLKNVISRLKKWKIKKRPADFVSQQAEQGVSPVAAALCATKHSERSSPWTCVSNCNRSEIEQRVNLLIQPIRPPLSAQKIDYLLKYKRVNLNKFTALCLENETLAIVPRNQNMITHFDTPRESPRYIQKLKKLVRQ